MNPIGAMFRQFCTAVNAGLKWNRAYNFASSQKYAESLAEIKSIERLVPVLPCRFQLLKAVMLQRLGQYEAALDSYGRAIELAQTDKGYSASARSYLVCFASVHGLHIAQHLGRESEYEFEVDYASVSLGNVPKHLKMEFPLRSHPQWLSSQGAKSKFR